MPPELAPLVGDPVRVPDHAADLLLVLQPAVVVEQHWPPVLPAPDLSVAVVRDF